MGRPRQLAVVVALAAAVRLAHLSAVASSTIPSWQHVEPLSDYAATWKWAEGIQEGNLLGSPTFHPYNAWMQQFGSYTDWTRWWGGEEIFQQAPLYAYLVALVADPPQGSPLLLLLLQAALGVVAVPFAASLGRRWGGPRAGILTALIYALAQPLVALDCFMLRDSLAISLTTIGLALLERVREAPRPALLAGATGLLLGVATLARENLLLLALASAGIAYWLRAGPSRARALCALAALGGLTVALSPLVARNLAVGAPALALSNRAPEAIIEGSLVGPGADPIGFQANRRLPELLERSQGSALRALGLVLEEALAQKPLAARLLARKSWALLSPYEPADNVDLDYLTWQSPVLRPLIPTGLIVWPALLGLAVALRRWRQGAPAVVAFVLLVGPLLVASVLWRLRAGILPVAVPLAGVGLAFVAQGLWPEVKGQARPWRELGSGALILFLTGLSYLYPPKPLFRLRHIESLSAARVSVRANDRDAALEELDAWLAQARKGRVETARIPEVARARQRLLAGQPP